jgi:Carbohydrate esterase, sialic acid-specific acetylesterase
VIVVASGIFSTRGPLCKSRVVLVALASLSATAAISPGTEPARPIDVYLIGGQSNATGQEYMANLPGEFVPDPRVLLFHSGRPHLNSGAEPNAWVPLRQASEAPDRFSPELGFGNRLQELMPDRRIALIKHAHSGTKFFSRRNPGRDASDREHFGPQFRISVDTVERGFGGLRDRGYYPTSRRHVHA